MSQEYRSTEEASEKLNSTLKNLNEVLTSKKETDKVISDIGQLQMLLYGDGKEQEGFIPGVLNGANHNTQGFMNLDALYEKIRPLIDSINQKIGKKYKFNFGGLKAILNKDNYLKPINYLFGKAESALQTLIPLYKEQILQDRDSTVKAYNSFLAKYKLT